MYPLRRGQDYIFNMKLAKPATGIKTVDFESIEVVIINRDSGWPLARFSLADGTLEVDTINQQFKIKMSYQLTEKLPLGICTISVTYMINGQRLKGKGLFAYVVS